MIPCSCLGQIPSSKEDEWWPSIHPDVSGWISDDVRGAVQSNEGSYEIYRLCPDITDISVGGTLKREVLKHWTSQGDA